MRPIPVTVVSTRFAVDAYPPSQLHLAVRVAARLKLLVRDRGEFVLLEDIEDGS